MSLVNDLVARLTERHLSSHHRRIALIEFARATGWRPSYELESTDLESIANGHLVLEHGLDNTAVISFLKDSVSFLTLPADERILLLSTSYNNLVDWHLFPQRDRLTYVFNRSDPAVVNHVLLSDQPDSWRVEAIAKIIGRRPNPNLKSLDRALIDTISNWKRSLAAELPNRVTLPEISVLFNSVLFVRALEDDRRHQYPNNNKLLLDTWVTQDPPLRFRGCIESCLRALGIKEMPDRLFDFNKLDAFADLDRETVNWLFRDFYDIRSTPYKYDFSMMSKHALSKIYEEYVCLLREDVTEQPELFGHLPEKVTNRTLGGYYTPQYIARFFARFLQENLPPPLFRSLKTCDPTCGSGIFLRTVLEIQCDPLQDVVDHSATVRLAYENTFGIDVDPNACEATRLSLYLLHLVLNGSFPQDLHIENAESMQYLERHPELRERFDAVIANPPYLKWDSLDSERQERIVNILGEYKSGKPDMFLAQLKLGCDIVKPGGFVLYVLPHSFLLGRNAAKFRSGLSQQYWVRFLADLSEIPVFERVGSYVILLILQKKSPNLREAPKATIVRCADFPGKALQEALDGKRYSTDFYHIYDVEQDVFTSQDWHLLAPAQSGLKTKLEGFPTLDKFLTIRQGFVTGADEIFIRSDDSIPANERVIFAPFLPDREMQRYSAPEKTELSVFYPYLDGEKIDEETLRPKFPLTWEYLQNHYDELSGRQAVIRGDLAWWSPERPRPPDKMLRPKIISPHLVLAPRFSLDISGRYAISHSPLMYPIKEGDEVAILHFFLAVLNSSVGYWQLANLSHRYSRGYLMLEKKTLCGMHVPLPTSVAMAQMKRIQTIVKELIKDNSKEKLEVELDYIIADVYSLSKAERAEIGLE